MISNKAKLAITSCGLAVLLAAMVLISDRDHETLELVHAGIETRFPTVSHISGDQLALSADKQPYVIFDVREPEEYAVSHIEGAIRVDPSISPDRFLIAYGEQMEGRPVVFYCSVGMRSSIIADAVQESLRKQGATDVFNLEGGLFAWHNDGRALVSLDGRQPTEFIHPFDSYWGQLIERQSLIKD